MNGPKANEHNIDGPIVRDPNVQVDVELSEALTQILDHFKCADHLSLFQDLIETGDSPGLDQLAAKLSNVKEAKELVERSMSHALKSVTRVSHRTP